MALKLMQFDIDTQYCEGSKNADALSRQSWPAEGSDSESPTANNKENHDENTNQKGGTSVDDPSDGKDLISADLSGGGGMWGHPQEVRKTN